MHCEIESRWQSACPYSQFLEWLLVSDDVDFFLYGYGVLWHVRAQKMSHWFPIFNSLLGTTLSVGLNKGSAKEISR